MRGFYKVFAGSGGRGYVVLRINAEVSAAMNTPAVSGSSDGPIFRLRFSHICFRFQGILNLVSIRKPVFNKSG